MVAPPLDQVTALVLAGDRAGRPDPMALAAGLAHKALLEVAGMPMLSRVLAALRATPQISRVVVCAQQSGAMLTGLPDAGAAIPREAADSPSRSVAAMLAEFGTPLLVTTADHPLLTSAMVSRMLDDSAATADALAAVARAATVRAAFPQSRRTWLRFRDGAYSGCNLFLLRNPRSVDVVRFWETLEKQRKRPLAMARLLGPVTMLAYALRLVTLDGMLRHLGRRTGAQLAAVILPFAEAAIDVDKPEDLELANTILLGRRPA